LTWILNLTAVVIFKIQNLILTLRYHRQTDGQSVRVYYYKVARDRQTFCAPWLNITPGTHRFLLKVLGTKTLSVPADCEPACALPSGSINNYIDSVICKLALVKYTRALDTHGFSSVN
jgi:hypothetical protein